MNEQIFWDYMSPAGWWTAGQGRHGDGEPHCSEACVRLKLSFTRTNSGIFCWFSRCLISSCSYWKKKHITTKTSLGSKIIALLRQYLDCYGLMLSRCCYEQQLHGQKLPEEAETRESFLAWLLLKRLAQFLFANFPYIFIFSHWARNNEQTTQPAFIWRDFFFSTLLLIGFGRIEETGWCTAPHRGVTRVASCTNMEPELLLPG